MITHHIIFCLKQFSGIYHSTDFLTFEIIIKSRKWYVSYSYRPPHINESILCDLLNVLCEKFISNNNLHVAYGDFNYAPAPPKVERGYNGFTPMSVRPSVRPSVDKVSGTF